MSARPASQSPVTHDHPLIRALRDRRNALNISQDTLGDIVGVHRNIITRWEHHEVEPLLGNFVAWANALGLTLQLTEKEPASS